MLAWRPQGKGGGWSPRLAAAMGMLRVAAAPTTAVEVGAMEVGPFPLFYLRKVAQLHGPLDRMPALCRGGPCRAGLGPRYAAAPHSCCCRLWAAVIVAVAAAAAAAWGGWWEAAHPKAGGWGRPG